MVAVLIFRGFITYLSVFETFPGQKLFSCHVCSNSFSTKGSLKVHMRLHTGAKPFKCPHCDLRFRTSGRRKTHIQCHYKPETKKVRKPVARTSAEGLQPVSLLNSSSTDPNVFIMNNSVWRVSLIKIYFSKDLWARLSCLLQCQVKMDDFLVVVLRSSTELCFLLEFRKLCQTLLPNR